MSIALLLPSFHTLSKMVIVEWVIVDCVIVYGSLEGSRLKWARLSFYLFNCLLYGLLYAFIKVLSTLIGRQCVYIFYAHCLDEYYDISNKRLIRYDMSIDFIVTVNQPCLKLLLSTKPFVTMPLWQNDRFIWHGGCQLCPRCYWSCSLGWLRSSLQIG